MTQKEKPDYVKAFEKLVLDIRNLQKRSHAGFAMVAVGMIETELEKALLAIMRPLSSAMRKKLFKPYAPLSTFSAKIDMAYALSIIGKETHSSLHVIRKIRNTFAHTTDFLDFASPDISADCSKLPDFEPRKDALAFYVETLKKIGTELESTINAPNSAEQIKDPKQPHARRNLYTEAQQMRYFRTFLAFRDG